jgi:2-iminobutanoate/2-iminopropanoate deaminase
MSTVTPAHPYSPVFEIDGVAYVSGAISVDAEYHSVSGREAALDAALQNLKGRLALVNLGLENVVKLTYFVTDISLRDEANTQMVAHFSEPRPARSFVEVSALPYGCSVEIEGIAHRNKR